MFGGGSGSTGFNFGVVFSSAATSSGGGFSFGAAKSTTAATTTNQSTSGIFNTTSTSSTSTIGPLVSQKPAATAAAAPAFKGLGGVDVIKKGTSNNDTNGKNDVICQAVQDQAVPDEICKDVKIFEDYVAKQKEESSEVGKFSVRSLCKITEEVKSLSTSISTISTAVNRNKVYVEKLREAFTSQLKHAEMAQRTQNIPPTLQPDNIAPVHYFVELANNFDENMKLYRQQIDELENHLQSVQTYSLTPQDISLALVKMQETFVTLASNLHSIHDSVKHLKEQYLAYRKIVHNDNVDVFAIQKENKLKNLTSDRDKDSCRCHLGMPAFQNLSNVAALAVASMMQPQQQAQAAPPQQTLLNPAFGSTGFGTTTNPFGSKTTTGGLFGGTGATTTSGGLFGGTGFGQSSISKPTALSAGVTSTSSGNLFFGNTSFNSSAGVNFGGAAAANKNTFDLKPPPAGNKRNKKLI